MYRITETNGTEHLSDTIVPITVSKSGCYVRKDEDPDGFTGKVPHTYESENPETGEIEIVEGFIDQPFVLPNKRLTGTEPEATYVEEPAVPTIIELEGDLEQAYELLYGGDV